MSSAVPLLLIHPLAWYKYLLMCLYVKHSIQFRDGSNSKFEVTIGPRAGLGKVVENVVLQVELPKTVMNMSLTPTQGKYTFDSVKKSLTWDIGKIDPAKIPSIRGNMTRFMANS